MLKEVCKILIVGGSGKRADQSFYPALLSQLDAEIELRLVAICDLIDPTRVPANFSLQKAIAKFNPTFVQAGREFEETESLLNELICLQKIDLVILSVNSTCHLSYALWAVRNGISVVCEKPIHTVINSSFIASEAKKIREEFIHLVREYQLAKTQYPKIRLNIDLGRRRWLPIVEMNEKFDSIYNLTNQGITLINVNLNCGIHRFPSELLDTGSHGYLMGVGILGHSAYHYIDLMTYLLTTFSGGINRIEMSLNYVQRLGDYLKSESYNSLKHLIGDKTITPNPEMFSLATRNSEIGVHFTLNLFDQNNNVIGLCTFSAQNPTFTPRDFPSIETQPNLDNCGMRMAQLFIDVHMGAFANYRLVENDIVGQPIKVEVDKRINKLVNLQPEYLKNTLNGEDTIKAVSDEELLLAFAKQSLGLPVDDGISFAFVDIESHFSTVLIYSYMYQLVANEFQGNQTKMIIELSELKIS